LYLARLVLVAHGEWTLQQWTSGISS